MNKPNKRTIPDLPVYTRQDLWRMGKIRKDATLHQVWPTSGQPHPDAFYFDMGNGDLRPSLLVNVDGKELFEKYKASREGMALANGTAYVDDNGNVVYKEAARL